ncbi:LytTR family DNA-binding domain-containing protein [Spirosoma profusum]|nr:LytTR family DNA-binding domain-containing protein [Spirosoma profusum]
MFSCWEVNLFIFRWLDDRLPFWQNPTRRLIFQIILGGVATLLTFAVVFPLAQRLYMQHWPTPAMVTRGVVVCVTLATFVNGGYVGFYLMQAFWAERQNNTSESKLALADANTLPNSQTLVSVDVSNGQLRLPPEEIAYFYSAGGLILLVKTDGLQIATRYASFAQLTPSLDGRYFFQLSRQFIVSLGAVRAVQDDVNRKLIVTLVPALHRQESHQEVVVSRYRRIDLHKWMQSVE